MRRELSLAFALAALVACSKTDEPAPGPPSQAASASPTPSAQAAPAAAPPAGAVVWTAPAAWSVAPNPSKLRIATYKIPKLPTDPEDADLSVSQAGGGAEANIKRWASQFEGSPELKVSHRDVGGLKVTIVDGHGIFNGGGMPGGPPSSPKRNWALLGAIVDSVDPPYFFKLTGPEKTVTAARADFDTFVGSLHTSSK